MIRNPKSTDWPNTTPPKQDHGWVGKTFLYSMLSLLPIWFLSQLFAEIWLWIFTIVFTEQLLNPDQDGVIAKLNAIHAAAIMTLSWAFFVWVITTGIIYHVLTRSQSRL